MGGTGKIKKFLFISIMLGVALMTSGFDFFNDFWDKLTPHSNEYGKFERIGDMHYARSGHKAVLLQDGRVLIVGGAQTGEPAEIYDPKKRKFKLIGKPTNWNGSTATLLDNGQVLLTGLAEHSDLFDPKTETFISTGKMNYPRYKHTATLLDDGRVLIVGGEALVSSKGKVLRKERLFYEYSEIYDPKTGKFELGPKIINKRVKHSSILLNDNNVLIVGGGNNDEWLKEAEIYDVKTNKFIEIGNIKSTFKIKPQMIKLKNGDILIFYGGQKFEIFSFLTKNFKFFMPDTTVERGFKAVLLKDGNILLTAGTKSVRWYGVSTKDSNILNPKEKTLIKGPNLNTKRSGHRATLLNDGTVLITGGYNNQTMKSMKAAEIFIPKNNK